MIIHLNVVVLRLRTVDLPLDFVAVVIEDEEVRVDASSQHCSDFLQCL